MKSMLCFTAAAFAIVGLSSTASADPFQNLNFEQAFAGPPSPPANPVYDGVPGVDALPGWTWTGVGSNISYNTTLLDGPDVSLWHGTSGAPYGVLQGSFSAMMTDAALSPNPNYHNNNISLSQTGLVPANALSVRFLVSMDFVTAFSQNILTPTEPLWYNRTLEVSLDGTPLSLVRTSPTGNFTHLGQNLWRFTGELGANVSGFAGQTSLLKFLMLPVVTGGADAMVMIDDIRFSPVAVPEPSSLMLAIAGAIGLLAFARKRARTAKS